MIRAAPQFLHVSGPQSIHARLADGAVLDSPPDSEEYRLKRTTRYNLWVAETNAIRRKISNCRESVPDATQDGYFRVGAPQNDALPKEV